MDAVERNGYELIPHPACSPDLAPSDFFLFPNLKKDIRGLHFRSDEEVVTAVKEWVNGKDPDFFSSGLTALEHRWYKWITLEGNYIEKEEVDLNRKWVRLVTYWLALVDVYFAFVRIKEKQQQTNKQKNKTKKNNNISTIHWYCLQRYLALHLIPPPPPPPFRWKYIPSTNPTSATVSYMGHVKRKRVFEHVQNAKIQIYPVNAQSLIRAFTLHWYII